MPASWRRQPAAITTSASRGFMPWSATIAGSTPAPVEQAEQAQGDVQHDPDVDPGVVGHAQPVGRDLLRVPPGLELLVGVGGVEQRLELAVAARRDLDLHRLDRLARVHRGAE